MQRGGRGGGAIKRVMGGVVVDVEGKGGCVCEEEGVRRVRGKGG